MRLQVKHWCAAVVLVVGIAVGLAAATITPHSHLVAHAGADLRGLVATRVALLTSPGHDPRLPTNPAAAWAAALDHALGAYWPACNL